jgi:hypothetical protein
VTSLNFFVAALYPLAADVPKKACGAGCTSCQSGIGGRSIRPGPHAERRKEAGLPLFQDTPILAYLPAKSAIQCLSDA